MHVPFSYLLLMFQPCLSTFALLLSIDAVDVLSLNTFCHFDGLLKFCMSFAEKKQNAKEEIVNYFISTAFNKLLRRLSCFMVLRPLARWSSPLKMVTNMWTKVILHETSIKINEALVREVICAFVWRPMHKTFDLVCEKSFDGSLNLIYMTKDCTGEAQCRWILKRAGNWILLP